MLQWEININECPNFSKDIKQNVNKKFKRSIWKNASKKREYYIAKFNPTYDHREKGYIRPKIK